MTRRRGNQPAPGSETPKPDEGKQNFAEFIRLAPKDLDKNIDLWGKMGGPGGGNKVLTFEIHLHDRRIKPVVRDGFATWRSQLPRDQRKNCDQYTADLIDFKAARSFIEMEPAAREAVISRPPGRVIEGIGDLLDGIGQAHEDLNNDLEKKLKALKRSNRRRMGR